MIRLAADELKAALDRSAAHGRQPIAGIGASGVVPNGWTYVAFDRRYQPWTTPTTPNDQQAPLKGTDIQRINESFRRARLTAEMARDALTTIKQRRSFGASMPPEEQAFSDYFGVYDANRFAKVLDNFNVIAQAFEQGPSIIDLRDTVYGTTCYAACYRRDLRSGRGSIIGRVEMYLGRLFLLHNPVTRGYAGSSDDTVVTLIHEFAHGAVSAVDVPPVDSTGRLTHGTKSDDPTHPDFGETMTNSIQASTADADRQLARFKPAYAAVNADNYGQLAKTILQTSNK